MLGPMRCLPLALFLVAVSAIDVIPDNEASVKQASATVVWNLMRYYVGNLTGGTPGKLNPPYYWWQTGAMFGELLDYWQLTGDVSYNPTIYQALIHQSGDGQDWMPRNETRFLGNDDHGFWAMTAMTAAEHNFTNPPRDQVAWLASTQAVFNHYTMRWDTARCDGGLRWQVYSFNAGYDYKNSVSNGCFFNIAARLARYTTNGSYGDWAEKIWTWEEELGVITPNYAVLDGLNVDETGVDPCSLQRIQWTYNIGLMIHGSANMYAFTKSEVWKTRLDGLIATAISTFFQNSIIYEPACEPMQMCHTNSFTFKGYLLRWMAWTTKLAPHTRATILPLLQANSKAAASICIGDPPAPAFYGEPETACGFSYLSPGQYDGFVGLGQHMSALAAIMYPLVDGARVPLTVRTGGSSRADPAAGLDRPDSDRLINTRRITTADKAGGAILTTFMVSGAILGVLYMMWDTKRL